MLTRSSPHTHPPPRTSSLGCRPFEHRCQHRRVRRLKRPEPDRRQRKSRRRAQVCPRALDLSSVPDARGARCVGVHVRVDLVEVLPAAATRARASVRTRAALVER